MRGLELIIATTRLNRPSGPIFRKLCKFKRLSTTYACLPFDFKTAFLSLAGSDTVSFTVWLNSCQTCQTCALDCISSPEVQLNAAAGHPKDLCLGMHVPWRN